MDRVESSRAARRADLHDLRERLRALRERLEEPVPRLPREPGDA